MSDVVVKEVVKVSHATACTDPRTCGCPRDVVGYGYEICFQWPSGNLFRERKRVPVRAMTKTKGSRKGESIESASKSTGERSKDRQDLAGVIYLRRERREVGTREMAPVEGDHG